MNLQFKLNFDRKTLTLTGIFGLVLLLGILALPRMFAISLDGERAKQEIRSYLKQVQSYQLLNELQASGARTPDYATAKRWEEAYKRIDQTEIVGVQIGHFLFVPPFSTQRIFIVKAVLRTPDQQEETRYFSLSSRNKYFNVFLVSEQPRWMWTFAF
jgi:hypothetical protein